MNIIDDRKKRTIRRKMRKREFDKMYTLSANEQNAQTVRLLDEGAVMGYNSPLFYIKKGTLRRYLSKLTDDYVGTINLGHMDFATFPFILGTWTKKDLHLVDIGDGRQALDVDLRLDEGNTFVQELRRAPYTLGVSAEFTYHVDEENTEKYNLEILDEIFIGNFAIVGECGNVNSSGIRLKGDSDMTVEQLSAALEGEHTDLGAINAKLDALLEQDAEKQLTTAEEEAAAAAEPPEEQKEAPAEEQKEEQAEEQKEEAEEKKEDSEEAPAEEQKELAGIEGMFKELMAKVEDLTAENAKLSAKLEAKEKAEQDFIARFKNLSVSLSTESETEVPEVSGEHDVFTDGIGEF